MRVSWRRSFCPAHARREPWSDSDDGHSCGSSRRTLECCCGHFCCARSIITHTPFGLVPVSRMLLLPNACLVTVQRSSWMPLMLRHKRGVMHALVFECCHSSTRGHGPCLYLGVAASACCHHDTSYLLPGRTVPMQTSHLAESNCGAVL